MKMALSEIHLGAFRKIDFINSIVWEWVIKTAPPLNNTN